MSWTPKDEARARAWVHEAIPWPEDWAAARAIVRDLLDALDEARRERDRHEEMRRWAWEERELIAAERDRLAERVAELERALDDIKGMTRTTRECPQWTTPDFSFMSVQIRKRIEEVPRADGR